ncbi:MAG: bifunctional ADP-dependent NAD(P)H-hydrate dehydratase/NAD(P)H-hydrate epimerase, partial [Rhodoferax sp.]|nr:bifunctional ADP-dependent NAD(P)H-hydrate dehydratase/NAD(P)H-hydrate epimerase [Rhodoferax sp.]
MVLHSTLATRQIEQLAQAGLPEHALMQRAGLSIAKLALAITPHAQRIWVACGSGNNGGDGLEAALHLKRWGKEPVVTWLGSPQQTPTDAHA